MNCAPAGKPRFSSTKPLEPHGRQIGWRRLRDDRRSDCFPPLSFSLRCPVLVFRNLLVSGRRRLLQRVVGHRAAFRAGVPNCACRLYLSVDPVSSRSSRASPTRSYFQLETQLIPVNSARKVTLRRPEKPMPVDKVESFRPQAHGLPGRAVSDSVLGFFSKCEAVFTSHESTSRAIKSVQYRRRISV